MRSSIFNLQELTCVWLKILGTAPPEKNRSFVHFWHIHKTLNHLFIKEILSKLHFGVPSGYVPKVCWNSHLCAPLLAAKPPHLFADFFLHRLPLKLERRRRTPTTPATNVTAMATLEGLDPHMLFWWVGFSFHKPYTPENERLEPKVMEVWKMMFRISIGRFSGSNRLFSGVYPYSEKNSG